MEGLTSRAAPALEEEIELAAGVSGRVMITADSQAMRRFVAQQIHQRSRRARNPFITTSCTRLLDDPEVLRKAVRGMLPRNRLGRAQLLKLKIYAGPEHPHEAQSPKPLPLEDRNG